MSLISSILPVSNIVLDLPATSKKRAFEHAALLFENHHGLARLTVFDSLFARERLGSTALGHGVAVPHGRIKGLEQPVATFIRLAQPVPFDAPDGQPVRILMFLLVPEVATQQHLEILAELAHMLSSKDLRNGLLQADSPDKIHAILANWQPAPEA